MALTLTFSTANTTPADVALLANHLLVRYVDRSSSGVAKDFMNNALAATTSLGFTYPVLKAFAVQTSFDAFVDAFVTSLAGDADVQTAVSAVVTAVRAGQDKNEGGTFTAEADDDTITATGHTLSNGDVIRVSNAGGALPTGLVAATNYYVRDVATNTFKLAATAGGAAINITTDGTGTQTFANQAYAGKTPFDALVANASLNAALNAAITGASVAASSQSKTVATTPAGGVDAQVINYIGGF